jgi:hypothetical protein
MRPINIFSVSLSMLLFVTCSSSLKILSEDVVVRNNAIKEIENDDCDKLIELAYDIDDQIDSTETKNSYIRKIDALYIVLNRLWVIDSVFPGWLVIKNLDNKDPEIDKMLKDKIVYLANVFGQINKERTLKRTDYSMAELDIRSSAILSIIKESKNEELTIRLLIASDKNAGLVLARLVEDSPFSEEATSRIFIRLVNNSPVLRDFMSQFFYTGMWLKDYIKYYFKDNLGWILPKWKSDED